MTTASWRRATRGDLLGGLTAGIIALPLALAFGVQSGLGAAAGLYGAIFLGFFAAVFGGTTSQISGPTGPMTVVTSATIAAFVATTGGVEAAIPALVLTFVLAGLVQVGMGLSGIGTLIRFIPYPVISGFMSGIGVIIILLQLFPALGQPAPPSTLAVAGELGGALRAVNPAALALAGLTIAVIVLAPRVTKAVPGALVALLVVTALSLLAAFDVPVIGEIPAGFPVPRLHGLLEIPPSLLPAVASSAATLAALGSIDSLLTSVVADNVTRTRHDSNRELVGQGIGNAAGGIFAGLPGAGATMRTLVNIRSGGRGRLSGVVHSLVLLAVLLGAGRYAAHIPRAVLAGILITVGAGILDYKGLRDLAKVPRADAVVTVVVLLVTVFLDLLVAVGVGMVMATLLFMKKMAEVTEERTELARLSSYKEEQRWDDEHIPPHVEEKVLVQRLDGPLFFGFAAAFQQRVAALPDVHYVIIRMRKVPFIDQTGLYALEDAILSLERRGVQVLLAGLQLQPLHMLQRIRVIPDLIESRHVFETFDDCVRWLVANVPDEYVA